MSLVRLVPVSLISLALNACEVPKFPLADSGTPAAPPAATYTCEEPDRVFCASGACGKICHKTDVPRQAIFSRCEKPEVVDGVRVDECADGSVCLEPAPNTAQGFLCFALCWNAAECTSGVACGERPLSDDASVRVCDPNYQNCGSNCCDPTDSTGNTCPSNRPCYLVPAPNINREVSWTVCEYSSGGAAPGKPCTLSRDCMEGLTCVGAENGAKGTCLVVCDPSKPDACGMNEHCQPFPKQWGYCL